MKTKYLACIIAVLTAIVTFQQLPTHAGLEAEVKRVGLTRYFYNAGDMPPALPFMSIIFQGIPDKETPKVEEWAKEIDAQLQKLGGVQEEADYGKIAKIIPEYITKFIGTGAVAIALEFPKKRQGMLIYQQKEPSNSKK